MDTTALVQLALLVSIVKRMWMNAHQVLAKIMGTALVYLVHMSVAVVKVSTGPTVSLTWMIVLDTVARMERVALMESIDLTANALLVSLDICAKST